MTRSVYSDPVGSAINAFESVTSALDTHAAQKQSRELMAQEIADKRLESEERQKTAARTEEQWGWTKKAYQTEEDYKQNIKDMDLISSAYSKSLQGIEPSDEESTAIIRQHGNTTFGTGDVDKKITSAQTLQNGLAQLTSVIQNSPNPGVKITKDQAPQLIDAVNTLYDDQINKGSDKYGNTTADGVKKTIDSVIVDKANGNLVFNLKVETPVRDGQVFKHIGGNNSAFTTNPYAAGMAETGNIDLSKRSVRRNADGSISTVSSISFEEDGKEILIPTISDSGQKLTRDEAIKEYHETGKHLGIFDTPEDATAYAEQLHADPMWNADIQNYSAKGQTSTSYTSPMTVGRDADPKAQVLQVPIALFDKHVEGHVNYGNLLNQVKAKLGDGSFAKEIEASRIATAKGKAVSQALTEVRASTGSWDDKRAMFVEKVSKAYPEYNQKELAEIAEKNFPKDTSTSYSKYRMYLDVAGGDANKARQLMIEDDLKAKEEGKTDQQIGGVDSEGNPILIDKKTAKGRRVTMDTGEKVGPKPDTTAEKTRVSKEKAKLEDKIAEANDASTYDEALKAATNPNAKAKISSIYRLSNQYIENGMGSGEAYEKAKKEIEAELDKRGIGTEEFKPTEEKPGLGRRILNVFTGD